MLGIKRYLLLILIFIGMGLFFYFDLQSYFSFANLKAQRVQIMALTQEHYGWVLLTFSVIYIIVTALSIPVASFLTVTAGFLFGLLVGTVIVVISATIGAFCLFLAVRFAAKPFFSKYAHQWLVKMRDGFQKDAFRYLLILRLIPLFPFWAVNIVAGVLQISLRTFLLTTFIGIIPGSFVYVYIGKGLGYLFDQDQTPDLSIIFSPQILLPLILLAILLLLPTVLGYKKRN